MLRWSSQARGEHSHNSRLTTAQVECVKFNDVLCVK